MSLPEWVETARGLIGGLMGHPVMISRRAFDGALYVSVRFLETVTKLVNEGAAKPMSEWADSQLHRIKSENIAAATAAHNKAITDRKKAEAEAAKTRAEANKINAEAAAVRTQSNTDQARFEIERLEREQRLAEARRQAALDRFNAAASKLQREGGKIYLPTEHNAENDENETTDEV